jgi:hypothetical protein
VTVKVNTPVAVDEAGLPNKVGGLVGSIQTAVRDDDAGVAVKANVFVLHEVE